MKIGWGQPTLQRLGRNPDGTHRAPLQDNAGQEEMKMDDDPEENSG
jgi:hypothetical protein